MKKILIFLVLTFSLVVLLSCNGKTPAPGTKARVGTWKTAQTIQPFLYEKYLADQYQVEVLPFTNPGDQKAALLAGSLDMCGSTVALALTAASKGEPVVAVCGLCNKCSALVVRKDSEIHKPSDLKGKKIAYVPGTMHHVLLLEVLRRAGLDPEKDVHLTRVDFFDMGQALSQGAVDAFLSGEPYPSLAVVNGYGRILAYPYYGEDIGTINAVMITTRDKIKNNRRLIQQLVNAHAMATEQLKSHPEEWLNLASRFGTDRKVLDIAVGNMELAWDLNKEYVQRAKNLAKRMNELGMISQMPDVDALFDLSFVEEARKNMGK